MTYLTRKSLSRRTVLRGAGACLALPFLESMIPAASSGLPPARTRLGFFYVPHGAVMDRFRPATLGAGFELSPTLRPLAAFHDKINVISDLTLPLAYTQDASAAANHSSSSAVYLSGTAMTKNVNKLGMTADQVAAKHLGQDTPLPSLELGIEEPSAICGEGWSCAYRDTISWQDANTPLPIQRNPQLLFERLFGAGGTPEERAAIWSESRSMLDTVTDQTRKLSADLPAEDRRRLDQYLTDVREVERRLELTQAQTSHDIVVPEKPIGIPEDFETHIKMMFDLQVLAWQTELTRISTLMLAVENSNRIYPGSGVMESFHPLSHHSNVPANKDRLAQLNAYHVSMFGYLLEKMASTPDGNGSLLDNSILMWGSGMSDSNVHNHGPLPIVVAGGGSGKIAGKRHISGGVGKDRPLSNLLLSILQKAGAPVESFGDSDGTIDI
ncbi:MULTISPECIES: DUF1552 domain-containing protein [unclassified Sphingobium]|uniref:DUF1552 domain-containing protein n=1 Tax=unclassified Sphingobium TaxID=2611147 RepID=UPI002223FFB3|nr:MULTISPECIES: DUF1552 domain-containing protein [unclassified Sphingobium]MCW2349316.1 hypothetical protein [Sphingobium sp. B12D2B]MCW2410905.1 hypothetical protein [Sphingobium sp. B8D3D]MCW2416804.1 hypothetical protein [Sphingobium sp. B8D3A]